MTRNAVCIALFAIFCLCVRWLVVGVSEDFGNGFLTGLALFAAIYYAAEKVSGIQLFLTQQRRVLITKIKVAGFGLNFQHCARMAFVGLGDSYEQYYQAIRRCHRFGQRQPVDVHIIVSDAERGIVENVRQKEAKAEAMAEGLLHHMRDFEYEELLRA